MIAASGDRVLPEQSASTGVSLRGRNVPTYIAVEGPIGVGKTTLARRIAETFHHELLLEEAELNPFLERFYQNRQQTALATQLFSFSACKKLLNSNNAICSITPASPTLCSRKTLYSRALISNPMSMRYTKKSSRK
jgi:DNA replication protein DnaC